MIAGIREVSTCLVFCAPLPYKPRMILEPLSAANFTDYERLTERESNGKTGCYCAFWHQKWSSMDEWQRRQKEEPLKNREVVRSRVDAGIHVGVLAYRERGAEAV